MTIKSGRAVWTALIGSVAFAALAACDGGSATAPARDHSGDRASLGGSASQVDRTGAAASQADHRKDPVALVNGKPMWANSKKYSAEESAQYHFKRDGSDFGAKTVEAYVTKAQAFVSKPPADALTLTRSNGDKLLYDPKNNIFAVATKDGTPRTMFKPRDGQAYWDQQVEREAKRASGDGGERYSRRSRSRSQDDG